MKRFTLVCLLQICSCKETTDAGSVASPAIQLLDNLTEHRHSKPCDSQVLLREVISCVVNRYVQLTRGQILHS